MNLSLKQAVLGLTVILFANISHTQTTEDGYSVVTRDLESWNSLQLKYKFSKKWTIGLEQGLRFSQNATFLDQSLTEFKLKWKPTDHLSFGTGLRYIYDRGGNNLFDHDFRLHLDAEYKHDLNRFDFSYRLRYQNRNELGVSSVEGDIFKNYLRFKVESKYNIKDWKLDPVFSTEIFRDLTRTTGSFDRLRFTLGTEYDFKKAGSLNFFYRVERDLGVSYPKTTYILGLGYTFTIKNKK
jgi:hypothetical protein